MRLYMSLGRSFGGLWAKVGSMHYRLLVTHKLFWHKYLISSGRSFGQSVFCCAFVMTVHHMFVIRSILHYRQHWLTLFFACNIYCLPLGPAIYQWHLWLVWRASHNLMQLISRPKGELAFNNIIFHESWSNKLD